MNRCNRQDFSLITRVDSVGCSSSSVCLRDEAGVTSHLSEETRAQLYNYIPHILSQAKVSAV